MRQIRRNALTKHLSKCGPKKVDVLRHFYMSETGTKDGGSRASRHTGIQGLPPPSGIPGPACGFFRCCLENGEENSRCCCDRILSCSLVKTHRSLLCIMSLSNTMEADLSPEVNEEALAESKKLPPHLLQKRLVQNSLSNSSSFEDPPSSELLVDNEYGQIPPGRIHGIHKKGGHHRLHGSSGGGIGGSLLMDGTLAAGGGGTSTPRSRSRSPSIGRSGGAVAATIITNTTIPAMTLATDGNSSLSSMDDFESDLLTDRAGVLDDLSESQRKLHSSKEFHVPATVLERMCEDSLEDNHAFSDVVRMATRESNFSSNASRVSHVSGSNAGDGMLEPLDECDEGLENDSLEDSVTDQNYYNTPQVDAGIEDENGNPMGGGSGHDPSSLLTTTVILTNMENLTLESANNDLQYQGYSSQAGSASLFESVGGVAGNASHAAGGDTVGSLSLPPVEGKVTNEPPVNPL